MTLLELHFFIGTQGDGAGLGIHCGVLNPLTGDMKLLGLAAEVRRPTWLELDASARRLFAVSEVGNKGECSGEVFSFGIDKAGSLHQLGRSSAHGGGSTHLCLSPSGKDIFAANFGGGHATRLAVLSDGSLGEAKLSAQHAGSGPHPRQNKPHPHGVTLSPEGDFLLVPDMGNDQVVIHALAADGFQPSPASICQFPAGSGPRLLVFGSDRRRAYLLSELSAELFVLDWDGTHGELRIIDQYPLDHSDADGAPSAAALLLSPDGRHLYASNRRSNTICHFTIDPVNGLPTLVQSCSSGGEKPWGAGMSPDGRWLLVANQASGNVVAFRRSPMDGSLSRTDGEALVIPAPTHIAFSRS